MFKETHPILGTRDIQRAIAFYTQRLGFRLAFGDKADPPNYVGLQPDGMLTPTNIKMLAATRGPFRLDQF
jgi:catechol 2,3-dioxygenase-like lactoylglutathione lyase family enzyme